MARHRNVRNRKYSDDFYDYDDEFGQSVEEEHMLGEADHYIYNRSGNRQAISNFLVPSDIPEDEVPEDSTSTVHPGVERRNSTNLRSLALTENEEMKLMTCLDKIRNVLDDTVPEGTIIRTILECDFNVDKALDQILNDSKKQTSAAQETVEPLPAKLNLQPIIDKNCKVIPSVEPVGPIGPVGVIRGFKVEEICSEKKKTQPSRDQSPASERSQPKIDQYEEIKVASRVKENKIDPTIQYTKERGSDKDHLYIVVIGHVDAGKSTLMGRLLCEVGEVSQKTLHKFEQESKKIGKQSFMYAWVLDETGEERVRGITMDVGRAQFETQTKRIVILDAPGHADFIPNMITGAGQADVALMVVDATRGEFETGFDLGGQTREHALLVRSLGVNQLAVAVNKLDTNSWSQDRFLEIKNKLKAFLKQAGFKDSDVTFVPCSGLNGENLVKPPSEPELIKWYKGPCLLEVIDKFNVPDRPVSKPLRMSINDIFKGMGSGFCAAGRIENGILNKSDKVLVCPTKEMAEVKSVSINDLSSNIAFAGDQVSVTLSGIDMQNVSIGYILSDPIQQVPVASRFEARLVVFNVKVPITKGYPVLIHHQSLVESASIIKLKALLNKSTGEILKKKPRCLGNNSVAVVDIEVCRPICIERYKDVKELGRVMLRVSGVTIAAGLVTDIFSD